MYCKVSVFFAYISVIYIIASIIYLAVSRIVAGTPLKDEIEKSDKLMKIRKESKLLRGKIFSGSLVGAIIIAYYFQPFKSYPEVNNLDTIDIKDIKVK